MNTNCPRCGTPTKNIDRKRIGQITMAASAIWYAASLILESTGHPLPRVLSADLFGFGIIFGTGVWVFQAKPRHKVWCPKCKYFANAEKTQDAQNINQ